MGQDIFIRPPIPQPGHLMAPAAEPAVIQHKHLHATFFGLTGDLQQRLFRKIKKCRFPVIN